MQRGTIGRYAVTTVGGEQVRAFVPRPLPPDPPLALDGPLQQALEAATLALGRLDAISTLLPDSALFLYTYVRKEAALSSQIEGTQSSFSSLLMFEMEEAPGVPIDDVTEVSNYVAAVEHGLQRIAGGFPMSNRLIREMHGLLLSTGRGSEKAPGEFRGSQNWIGGTRPGNAMFVPPPAHDVAECMGALERFLHAEDDGLPVLVRAALAHVQFETVHPFLDGNGRIGRLLITLLLAVRGVLHQPLLYLSLYLKEHRAEYYDLLQRVRGDGDWEAWLDFFLEGVRSTAEAAVQTSRRLADVFAADRAAIQQAGGSRAGSILRVYEAMKERPVLRISTVCERTGLTFPTASAAMKRLVAQGIAREATGRRRGQVFVYDAYVSILNEGTETP